MTFQNVLKCDNFFLLLIAFYAQKMVIGGGQMLDLLNSVDTSSVSSSFSELSEEDVRQIANSVFYFFGVIGAYRLLRQAFF